MASVQSETDHRALTADHLSMAKFLILAGFVLVGLGLVLMTGFPLGRLPGDFVIRRGSFTFYFPLATSILVSVILTVLFTFLRR